MSKVTVIPAGYRVSVTSWENDGDNYNTKTIEGLESNQVSMIVAVCQLMKSGLYGNLYEPSPARIEAFRKELWKIALTFPDAFHANFIEDEIVDEAWELIAELGLTGGDFYSRVFERIKIEHIKKPIKIADVTDEFLCPIPQPN